MISILLYTGWSISNETEKKIEYLNRGSTKRTYIFTKDRGMFTRQIRKHEVGENLC